MPRSVIFNIGGIAMDVISGSSMYEQPDMSDPLAKEVAEALRYADEGFRGRGRTYGVTTTPDAAVVIMGYCQKVGGTLRGEGRDSKRDADALLVVADRIYWRLRELGEKVTDSTR